MLTTNKVIDRIKVLNHRFGSHEVMMIYLHLIINILPWRAKHWVVSFGRCIRDKYRDGLGITDQFLLQMALVSVINAAQ